MSEGVSVRLRNVTTKVGSGATPRGGEAAYKPTGIPLIRSMNVHFDGFRRDGLAFLDEEQARALKNVEVRAGDVLLNITGASIGRVTVAPTAMDGARVNQHVCIIRPDHRLDSSYLRWYLASPSQQRLINGIESGATRQALTKEKILEFEVPLLPLSRQRAIVAEIEKQFSRLDEAVANLKRVKAKLQRYQAAILNVAIDGRLVDSEAQLARRAGRTYESGDELLARVLQGRRTSWSGKGAYREPTAPVEGYLSRSPDGWAVASLEAITSANRVICYGILMPKENVADGVLYVKVRDMKNDTIDLASLHRTSHAIATSYARASLRADDLLVSIRGTYGRVSKVPPELEGGNITQDTARLDICASLESEFVATFLRSETAQRYFRAVARGVAVKGVNIGDLRPMAVPIPPLNEQRRIVAEVERRLSIAREVAAEVDINLVRAQAFRRTVLRRMFQTHA